MWATSIIFKKLPKVNNHLLGENSPNLVTLLGSVVVGVDRGIQSRQKADNTFFKWLRLATSISDQQHYIHIIKYIYILLY
jgi:hypothetical protein